MENGTVKWFDLRKNYGFIERETGSDVFVHRSDVNEDRIITEGDRVTFEVEDSPRGLRAINVTVEGA